ncbi:Peptidase family M50 [Planctopirus ephydatiae]|uniref:Peptidase family M50 n=1 Tax=Planctopirus ephydatiae TaxID=2528019 RepID=A0A518GP47_9PLAN|nr:site-2 protease family protein [Planctopirus ephydatiae]QDV30400.1 Peptidase family M50 [Planctopirus ephydatiae]
MAESEKSSQRKTLDQGDSWVDPLQPMAPKKSWFGRKQPQENSVDQTLEQVDPRHTNPSAKPSTSLPETALNTAKSTSSSPRVQPASQNAAANSAKPRRVILEREMLPGELARMAARQAVPSPSNAANTVDHELKDDDFLEEENEQLRRERELEAKRLAEQEKQFRSRHWAIWLFFMTCVTTFLAGLNSGGGPGPAMPEDLLRDGLIYSGCVMAILCAHELGHYLQSKRHGLPFYYPYFIPFPFGIFGTLGATVSSSKIKLSRSALLDIATTGPLFGLIVTLPIALYGAATSIPFPANAQPGFSLSDPPILRWMIVLTHPQLGPNDDVLINPALLAGWFGIYWTALNLVPIGQLDGGQIMTALIGRRAEVVSKLTIVVAVVWMLYSLDLTFSTMLGLMAIMGIRSAEIENETIAPSKVKMALGWLLLAFLLIGFTPIPFRMAP